MNNKNIPSAFSEYKLEKNSKVRMCQKVFRRRMVLEVEEDNLEKVAAEIRERGKEQTNKTSSRSYQRALP